jgi:hypothetical protein
MIPTVSKYPSNAYLEREREHMYSKVLDEKSIPASKIAVSWAMGDSIIIPYSVPPRFQSQGADPPPLL